MQVAYIRAYAAGASRFPIARGPWLPLRNLSFSTKSPATAAHMAGSSRVVEHVVLFKVKDGVSPQQADALVSGLRSLKSLDLVTELSAGPALQVSPGSYTHALHCRHKDKDALAAYAAHPFHLDVVSKCVVPIVEDVLALDWEADLEEPDVESGYGAVRIAVMKPKDNLPAKDSSNVVSMLKGCRELFPLIKQVSVGNNFSPARAKGFEWGFLALFPSLQELREWTKNEEHENLPYSKVQPLMKDFAIIDYSTA